MIKDNVKKVTIRKLKTTLSKMLTIQKAQENINTTHNVMFYSSKKH